MTITSFYLDTTTVHVNVLFPNTLTPLALSPEHYSSLGLESEAKARAEGRRQKAFPIKLDLPFPSRVFENRETGELMPLSPRVFSWLISMGLAFSYANGLPSHDDLTEHLLETVYSHGKHLIRADYYDQPVGRLERPYVLLGSKLDSMAENAALMVAELYDPRKKSRLSAAGAKGGKTSKRPPVFTIDMLAGIEDLSPEEQMAVVGCKRRRIFELRKELRAYRALETAREETPKPEAYSALPDETAPEAYRALARVTDLTVWRKGREQASEEVSAQIDALLSEVTAPTFANSGRPTSPPRDPASARYPTET